MKTFVALAPLAALACLAGCNPIQQLLQDNTALPKVCNADSECGSGEVCFSDGCGSPERELVVEVVPDTRAGSHAQDFAVTDFRSTQDLQLFPPAAVLGQLTQGGAPYSGRVLVKLAGQSELIPGRERVYGGPLAVDRGAFMVPTGTGSYSPQLIPLDPALPPITLPDVHIEPGRSVSVTAALPAASAVVKLSGTLVRTLGSTAPLGAAVDVQAVDPDTLGALSQRVTVDAATGAFTLAIAPEAAARGLIGIKAFPRETSTGPALIPDRVFTVPSQSGAPQQLVLGDFGAPVTVSGRVLGSDGAAIAGATVYLEGKVRGGGHFTSARVKTDAAGRFDGLPSLPSDSSGDFNLWAVPPPLSTSGQLRAAVTVTAEGGFLRDFRCPDRVPVQGKVYRPDGRDFPGVRVRARGVASLNPDTASPTLEVETTTDENSSYTLHLDPGVWRLDFESSEPLPHASRQVTVHAELSATGGNKILSVPALTFSKGRTVTGTVSGYPVAGSTQLMAAPYATVRYYRVVTVEGHGTAQLLAEDVADDQAHYSVVLPTH